MFIYWHPTFFFTTPKAYMTIIVIDFHYWRILPNIDFSTQTLLNVIFLFLLPRQAQYTRKIHNKNTKKNSPKNYLNQLFSKMYD